MPGNNLAVGNKKSESVSRWANLLDGKHFEPLLIGTAGLFLLGLCLYLAWVWNTHNRSIQFSPNDVVYGVPLHAQHEMDTQSSRPNSVILNPGNAIFPHIQISENFFDFGEINPNKVVSRTFVIANKGSTPLIILRAYTTCGCTMADFTAAEIPPGKVALMTLQFDTGYHDMSGTTVRRGVMIQTNDPDHPTQEIWIQASVR